MRRMIATALVLLLVLAGCNSGKTMPKFGAMPPVVPDVTAHSLTGGQPTAPSGAALAGAGDGDTVGPTVMQELDARWASSDWDSVIILLRDESDKPEPALNEATLKEKLYAAHINAGHAALRQERKEDALEHFFAALEIAPERGEGDDGLALIQRSYMDEARELLEDLQQQQEEQQAQAEQPAPAAEPPADPQESP